MSSMGQWYLGRDPIPGFLRTGSNASVMIRAGKDGIELLAGFYEGSAFAQPFQFFGTGIGAGTADATE